MHKIESLIFWNYHVPTTVIFCRYLEDTSSSDFHLSMPRPFCIRISMTLRITASGISLLVEEMPKISTRSSYRLITSCARNSITMQIIYDRISRCSEVTLCPVRKHSTGLIGNSDIGEIHLIILHAWAWFRWKIIVFELYAAERRKSATYELARYRFHSREIIPSKVETHHLYAESLSTLLISKH